MDNNTDSTNKVDLLDDVIMHYGTPGMRWGIIRSFRYKNRDGSLNSRGKRRVAKLQKQYKALTNKNFKTKKKKEKIDPDTLPIRKLNNTQLKDRISRLENERRAKSLENDMRTSKGKKFLRKVGKEVLAPAAINAGRDVLQSYFKKKLYNLSGLNNRDVDELTKMKKDWQKKDYQIKMLKADREMNNLMNNRKKNKRYR